VLAQPVDNMKRKEPEETQPDTTTDEKKEAEEQKKGDSQPEKKHKSTSGVFVCFYDFR
jgi:hypothetical protein